VNKVDTLWVLKGGYNAWKEAGYPMEAKARQESLMLVPGHGDNYMIISGGDIYVGK
jgi:3-mercaptopyruvate sulfurtransferase SseA